MCGASDESSFIKKHTTRHHNIGIHCWLIVFLNDEIIKVIYLEVSQWVHNERSL